MVMSMVQFSYKAEAIQNLISSPEDRSKVVKALIEKLGGKMLSFYYTYGEYDGFVIAEMPDNVTALATFLASSNPATISKLKTTILIPVSEAMQAMKKAQGLTIKPPKGK
jgi:uncharacterized protein with GYD domain